MQKVLGALAIWGSVTGLAHANLVTNGSFETIQSAAPPIGYPVGSTAIQGWTVIGTGISTVGIVNELSLNFHNGLPIYYPASEGAQWADFSRGGAFFNNGLRSNAIAVSIGSTYKIEFDISDRNENTGNSIIGLSINNASPVLFTNVHTPNQQAVLEWERFTTNWIADTSSLQIAFVAARPATGSVLTLGIDNVAVNLLNTTPPTPLPEPSSLLLMLAGLTGLSCLTIKRRNKS